MSSEYKRKATFSARLLLIHSAFFYQTQILLEGTGHFCSLGVAALTFTLLTVVCFICWRFTNLISSSCGCLCVFLLIREPAESLNVNVCVGSAVQNVYQSVNIPSAHCFQQVHGAGGISRIWTRLLRASVPRGMMGPCCSAQSVE